MTTETNPFRGIIEGPSGKISIITFIKTANNRGLTKKDAESRLEKMSNINGWQSLRKLVIHKDELNAELNKDPKRQTEKLIIDNNNKLKLDESIEGPFDKTDSKINSIRTKLKSNRPLNDDEIDLLLGMS